MRKQFHFCKVEIVSLKTHDVKWIFEITKYSKLHKNLDLQE